jgi:hypothetical protein
MSFLTAIMGEEIEQGDLISLLTKIMPEDTHIKVIS